MFLWVHGSRDGRFSVVFRKPLYTTFIASTLLLHVRRFIFLRSRRHRCFAFRRFAFPCVPASLRCCVAVGGSLYAALTCPHCTPFCRFDSATALPHNTPPVRYCTSFSLILPCCTMTTTPVPTVIKFARHAAGNLTTFSGAYLLTLARFQRTAAFLAAGAPLMLKGPILGDPSLTIQWMDVANGRTAVVLTRPVVATDTTSTLIYLASLGDDLAQATPVALATSIATDMVVTLVCHADAVILGLPGCAAVPGQLDPPPTGDGVVDQAGIDRLHFAPVFAVLPLVYPLALGKAPFLQSITILLIVLLPFLVEPVCGSTACTILLLSTLVGDRFTFTLCFSMLPTSPQSI
jgi:hypothetical protein